MNIIVSNSFSHIILVLLAVFAIKYKKDKALEPSPETDHPLVKFCL